MFADMGGGGIEVNFGTSEDGMGDEQPLVSVGEQAQQQQQKETPPPPPPPQEESKTLTQDVEDAPAVEEPPKKPVEKKPKPKPIEKPKEQPKKEPPKKIPPVVEQKPQPEPPKPVVNSNALYKGKKTTGAQTSGGEGETGKPGDQGIKEGSLYAKKHGNQMGSGTGGTGTGSGSAGDGPGSGGGYGSGVTFNLDGRRMTGVPRIEDRSQETGKVVVAITVDKSGSVIKAEPGARGSTTTSAALYAKAKEAALKAKFNSAADAAEIQKGTITFVFIVQ